MPRLPIEQYAAQKQGGTVSGFDAAKFDQLQANAYTVDETAPVTNNRNGLTNFAGGVLNSLSKPGRALQSAFSKGIDKVFGTQNFGLSYNPDTETAEDAYYRSANLDRGSFADKAGNFVGEVGQFATPTGVYKAGARGLLAAGSHAATVQSLNQGEINSTSAVAGATGAFVPPVVNKIAGWALGKTGQVGKNLLAVTGRTNSDVIDTIIKNPQAARQGLREAVTRSDDAITIQTATKNLQKAASDEFSAALDNLPKRLGRPKDTPLASQKTTIKQGGNKQTLTMQGVKSSYTSLLRQFDVDVNPRKATLDFFESPLDNAESNRLVEVLDVINNWSDTTPRGFHKLSRKISNYRKSGEQSAELNAIIDGLSRRTMDYVAKRVPDVKPMLDNYQKAQNTIGVLEQEFGTKARGFFDDAQRIKTERKLSTSFSGEKATGQETLQNVLGDGGDLIGREAGRQLAQNIKTSTTSLGDIIMSLVNTVIDPKAVGQIAAQIGVSQQKLLPFLQKVQLLDPAQRAIMVAAFVELLEPLTDSNQSMNYEADNEQPLYEDYE